MWDRLPTCRSDRQGDGPHIILPDTSVMSTNPPPDKPRPPRRLMGGLLRSNTFAWTISILLHAALFMAFYKMGFGKAMAERRLIIPEARLVAEPTPVVRPSGLPRRLTERTHRTAATPARTPRLSELPRWAWIRRVLPDTMWWSPVRPRWRYRAWMQQVRDRTQIVGEWAVPSSDRLASFSGSGQRL